MRAGESIDGLLGAVANLSRRLAQLGQQWSDDGSVLVAERDEKVIDSELWVIEGLGLVDGGGGP